MILAGTGHRPDKLGNEYSRQGPVSEALRAVTRTVLLRENPEEVVSGMALGFDMILAEVAIALGAPVTAAIPFAKARRRRGRASRRSTTARANWMSATI